jgi:hypothetical protein
MARERYRRCAAVPWETLQKACSLTQNHPLRIKKRDVLRRLMIDMMRTVLRSSGERWAALGDYEGRDHCVPAPIKRRL